MSNQSLLVCGCVLLSLGLVVVAVDCDGSGNFGIGVSDVTVSRGENAVFNCNGSGSEAVTWLLNSNNATGQNVEVVNSTLTLFSVNSSLNGSEVTCQSGGCVIGNATLIILYVNTVSPKIVFTTLGGSVVIDCDVSGHPIPQVQWYFNNKVIGNGTRLEISNVLLEDGGVYRCEGTNNAETVSSNTTVVIAPNITFNEDEIVEVGSSVSLICTVKSFPPANITLYKSPNDVLNRSAANSSPEQNVIHNIESATLADDGTYTCRAETIHNTTAQNVSIMITTPSPSPTAATALPIVAIAAGAGSGGALILAVILIITIICCYCCCCKESKDGYKDMENGIQPRSGSFIRSGSIRLSFRKPKPGDPVGDYRRANHAAQAISTHPVIPVKGFLNRLAIMRMNDNQLFMEEFGSIPMQPLYPRDISEQAQNKEKNRYDNILPYDHTRVKLSVVKWQQGSEYINANYLDGYMKSKAYIATQGPIASTIGDFWRMIWEEDSRTIVMLTNTHEKGTCKCEMYWPSECDRQVTYGSVEVTMTEVIPLADYTIRSMSIMKGGAQKESRIVKQFHFTSWPDHGVPDFPTAMLSMVRVVRAHHNAMAHHGPMTVHCSAGVGRTGTFVVIDSSLQRILSGEETVDIYAHVSLLRNQRNFMVQTEDQYFFIHEAVAEAIECGVTEVKVDVFPRYLEQLEQLVGVDSDTTGIELEFRRLAIDRTEPHRFASATKAANKDKNRFVNIMPYEYNRTKLNYIRGVEGSDYINASFIDSYRSQKAFIATQGPLAETVSDLWRMLWQNKSPVLVMLTKLVERRQVRCAQYWPTESGSYGNITVDVVVSRDSGNYMYREFKLTHCESADEPHTVHQFQFLGWPETGVPSTGHGILELLHEVQNLYTTLSSDKPITVMCSSGVGRTAVFITLHIILERLAQEGVIDLFQTVKMLRIQRPAMVQTLELYHCCYNIVLDHLQHTSRVRTSSTSLERRASLRGLRSDSSPRVVNEAPPDKTSTFGHNSNGASQDGLAETSKL